MSEYRLFGALIYHYDGQGQRAHRRVAAHYRPGGHVGTDSGWRHHIHNDSVTGIVGDVRRHIQRVFACNLELDAGDIFNVDVAF